MVIVRRGEITASEERIGNPGAVTEDLSSGCPTYPHFPYEDLGLGADGEHPKSWMFSVRLTQHQLLSAMTAMRSFRFYSL